MLQSFKTFISLKDDEFNLKYIFDHFRNIAVACTIILSGIFLFNYLENEFFPYSNKIFGIIIIILGLILLTLNNIQPLWSFKNKLPAIIYILIGLLYFLTISSLITAFLNFKP